MGTQTAGLAHRLDYMITTTALQLALVEPNTFRVSEVTPFLTSERKCWPGLSTGQSKISLILIHSCYKKTYLLQSLPGHDHSKVPNPLLRDALRRAIIERVISGYRDYLKEQPELAE